MENNLLIFEQNSSGRYATSQAPNKIMEIKDIPKNYLRTTTPLLPEASELQVVRHYTNLSRKNFSIDTHFYPLGSCTMKYNPRGVKTAAMLSGFLNRHPLAPESHSQGFLSCLYELQEMLKEITGMTAVSLTPMAGAQGEFAGVAMIRAYHQSRKDYARTEMLVPDAAHGTNPASAVMCGYTVKEIPTLSNGDVDLNALKAALGPHTAGIMLTNPSTLGVFETQIAEIAKMVHDAGGLLYYDGANLNAILGKVRPGDMGFDVMHMNLHKTFATPHGGGGPGSGPIAANDKLKNFLPIPIVGCKENKYYWLDEQAYPNSIGRLSAFMGNAGILIRAYAYIRLLGKEGLHRVAEFATLNANYLMVQLKKAGYTLAFPTRRASHEFIITLTPELKAYGVNAMDVAKRLLDFGIHAPTAYFPLLIPECLLIEPTETESKETLDNFIEAMTKIMVEIKTDQRIMKTAPQTLPLKRLDEVKAARELDITWGHHDDATREH
ncbi:MAG TPA: aminomethyl-transferring glycine dehydrogenase subunit GcvPB [Gammaproteobacteria bacterium]|nr:aminomethyl-transferring glycine dehydrogenase subunit GcvPB [Gammaproteobacteria bacterium]